MATDPTRQELEDSLAQWRAADTAAAQGQSYTIDGLTITRADAGYIKHRITFYRRQLIDLDVSEAGGRQGQRVPVWN